MKKPILFIAAAGLLGVAAIVFIIFGGSPSGQKQLAKLSPTPAVTVAATHAAAPEVPAQTAAPVITPAATPPAVPALPTATPVATPESIPEPNAADLSAAVFSAEADAELKFLTTAQKAELQSAAMVNQPPAPVAEQAFQLTWLRKDATELNNQLPTLPAAAPVYLLDRPTDTSVFTAVKQLAQALGLKGSVVRTDSRNYAVTDVATGDTSLNYDLSHLTFNARSLALAVSGGADGVKAALTAAGLLGFPHTVTETTLDSSTWFRFTPQLPLPVVALDPPTDDGVFTPGQTGAVDVALGADGRISEIRNGFPNITEKSSVTLATPAELAAAIGTGTFRLGDVELQYPGAMELDDKRRFFDLQRADTVAITDAEVSSLACGYFAETDAGVQALLAPVCIVSGKGKVDAYSVLFRVVVSAVQ